MGMGMIRIGAGDREGPAALSQAEAGQGLRFGFPPSVVALGLLCSPEASLAF